VRASRFCIPTTAYSLLSNVLHAATARFRSIPVFDGSLKRSPCMMHCIILHHLVPPGKVLKVLRACLLRQPYPHTPASPKFEDLGILKGFDRLKPT